MKKILVAGLSESVGGIENLFLHIIGKTHESISYSILCFGERCAYESIFIGYGCKIYHIPTRNDRPFSFNKIVIRFYIENPDFDYIWFNTASTSIYQIQYYGKKYTKAKIITHSHGTSFDSNSGKAKYYINRILDKVNKKRVNQSTDFFFCCSIAAGESLFGKKYKEKLILVRNGIDTAKFAFNDNIRNEIRGKYNISDKSLVVGFIGRLSNQKNPLKAISIFEKLEKCCDSKLVIIGDGELKNDMLSRINNSTARDSILYLGFKDNVEQYMNMLDILLMPSVFEGLPLTAIEAQCNGLKCVLSASITRETDITNNCYFIDHHASDDEWSETIEKIDCNYNRAKYSAIVKDNKYDMNDTVEMLKSFLGVQCE